MVEQVAPWKPTDWIVAIDPGLMTGYSVWHVGDGFRADLSGQMGWEEFSDWLWTLFGEIAKANETCHVQSEMFTISARTIKTQVRYESLYVNGVTLWMCRQFGFTHAFSRPESVMRLFTNDALRALGLYRKGLEHQHDSARHLGFVLLQRNIIGSRDWTKPKTEIE
jgi:hypothetical protein